jgi:hypothetical protein
MTVFYNTNAEYVQEFIGEGEEEDVVLEARVVVDGLFTLLTENFGDEFLERG